jgi:glucose/arabinose dehydrogenase
MKRSVIGFLFAMSLLASGHPAAIDRALADEEISPRISVRPVLKGLDHPWTLVFGLDGALYFTERSGRLSRWDLHSAKPVRFSGVPKPRAQGEAGLLGMALDPGFAENGFVYLCYSTNGVNGAGNRVSRFRLAGDTLRDEAVLLDHMAGARYHNGCRVILAPDGKHLFISMGEATRAAEAQNLNYRGGKIFRIDLDGGIPADNPFPNSPVWSFGHRNPQGLRFRPNGEFWSTEHGPNTQDELNLIVKGGNYGWPECRGTDPCPGIKNYHPAIAEFTHDDTIAISDLIFYQGTAFPDWQGDILFVSLKAGRLYRLQLDGDKVVKTEILIDDRFGRLRDIAEAPDGTLYISTDNDDDSILHVTPKE